MLDASLREIKHPQFRSMKLSVLVVWILLLCSVFLNVILEIGVGGWYSDGSFGIDKTIRISSVFILFMFFCYASLNKSFIRKIHTPALSVFVFSYLFLILYVLSSMVNGYGISSEHMRLFIYIFAMGLTTSGNLRFSHENFCVFFKLFFLITLTFMLFEIGDIFLNGIFAARFGIGIVDPNYLSAVISIALIYPLMVMLTSNKLSEIIIAALASMLLIVFKLLTGSTGGVLSLIVTFVSMLIMLNGRQGNRYVTYLALSIFFPAFILSIFLPEIFSQAFYRILAVVNNDVEIMSQSVDSRMIQYQKFFALILQDNFSYVFGVSSEKITSFIGQELHNSFLRPILAGGIFSFILFLFLNAYVFVIGKRATVRYRRLGLRNENLLSVLLLSFFVGWCFQSLTVPQETLPLFWAYFSIILLLNKNASQRYFEISNPINCFSSMRN